MLSIKRMFVQEISRRIEEETRIFSERTMKSKRENDI